MEPHAGCFFCPRKAGIPRRSLVCNHPHVKVQVASLGFLCSYLGVPLAAINTSKPATPSGSNCANSHRLSAATVKIPAMKWPGGSDQGGPQNPKTEGGSLCLARGVSCQVLNFLSWWRHQADINDITHTNIFLGGATIKGCVLNFPLSLFQNMSKLVFNV